MWDALSLWFPWSLASDPTADCLFFWLKLGALPSGHAFEFSIPHVATRTKRKFLYFLSLAAWDAPPEENKT